MGSCSCEQFFGRLKWLPPLTSRAELEANRSADELELDQPADPDKLLSDLKMARHDAIMAESAMRSHLVGNSLAVVPAEGVDALVADSARAVARYSEALENLSRLSCRAKAMGVQS
jgi:hypothetical protein